MLRFCQGLSDLQHYPGVTAVHLSLTYVSVPKSSAVLVVTARLFLLHPNVMRQEGVEMKRPTTHTSDNYFV